MRINESMLVDQKSCAPTGFVDIKTGAHGDARGMGEEAEALTKSKVMSGVAL